MEKELNLYTGYKVEFYNMFQETTGSLRIYPSRLGRPWKYKDDIIIQGSK